MRHYFLRLALNVCCFLFAYFPNICFMQKKTLMNVLKTNYASIVIRQLLWRQIFCFLFILTQPRPLTLDLKYDFLRIFLRFSVASSLKSVMENLLGYFAILFLKDFYQYTYNIFPSSLNLPRDLPRIIPDNQTFVNISQNNWYLYNTYITIEINSISTLLRGQLKFWAFCGIFSQQILNSFQTLYWEEIGFFAQIFEINWVDR